MADGWYYGRHGNHLGPVESERLVELARSGELLQTDLVWREGMPEWMPTSRVPELNQLPYSKRYKQGANSWLDGTLQHLGKQDEEAIVAWLLKPKLGSRLVIYLIVLSAALAIAAFLALATRAFPPLLALAGVFLLIAIFGLLLALNCLTDIPIRRQYLIGRWDAGDGDAPSIQFTSDGNIIRSDGVSGQYTYSVFKETLDISINQAAPVELKVTSLSPHELYVSDGLRTSYYKKGETLTDLEAKKEMEATKQQLLAIGKTVAVVAGATALVGLAVLGSAADSMAKNAEHDAYVPKRPCPRCGTMVPVNIRLCLGCGNFI